MKPLYQLVEQHRELERLADSPDFDAQVLRDTLDGLSGEITLKSQSVAAQILNLEAWAAAAKDAAKRMNERAAAMQSRADWLRDYLLTNLQGAGISKVESAEFRVAVKKSPPAVAIAEGAQIPDQFMVHEPAPPPRVDKKALAAALKAGERIAGCELVSGIRLEIR